MALDGTLWVENNVPYMVYCHEWVQLHGDGTMELVELSEDLSQTIGTPMVLFNGSAESRIRDTDMAEEMVNYSKNNILAQAGQSMLAQAM